MKIPGAFTPIRRRRKRSQPGNIKTDPLTPRPQPGYPLLAIGTSSATGAAGQPAPLGESCGVCSRPLMEHVVKVKGGYRVVSHRTGKNLGTYPSKAAAQKAIARMAHFREAQDRVGACRYTNIGGRLICVTGGHNHTAQLKEGEHRTMYYGGAQPGRLRRKALLTGGG